MTDDVLVLFASAAGVSVWVYCLTGVIIWYVTSMALSLRWLLDPPHKMLGIYLVFDLALG